jgi:Holliday junction resolvase RusA-like endonuclease
MIDSRTGDYEANGGQTSPEPADATGLTSTAVPAAIRPTRGPACLSPETRADATGSPFMRVLTGADTPLAPSISFTVPGIPTPWARAAGGATRARFTPARQRSAAATITQYCWLAMRGGRPLEGPVCLMVRAIYPWPASWSARKRARPGTQWKTSRPDVDNVCIKIVADALNGVAFIDDAQIVEVHAWKIYGEFPGLQVIIEAQT